MRDVDRGDRRSAQYPEIKFILEKSAAHDLCLVFTADTGSHVPCREEESKCAEVVVVVDLRVEHGNHTGN